MILVDTSIWIDHLHRSEAALSALLNEAQVSTHPMIIGELALGSLRDRKTILGLLSDLPSTPVATPAEVLPFVERHALYGVGLSLVDAHLLAALRLSSRDRLWTRDRRLAVAADRLGVAADLPA
jgi:predicted nucleic acid-binding protein